MKKISTEVFALLVMAAIFFAIPYAIGISADRAIGRGTTEEAVAVTLARVTVPLYSIRLDPSTKTPKPVEVCHGFNARVNDAKDVAFIVTAGHCGGDLVAHIPGTGNASVVAILSQSLYQDTDFEIGTKPFCGAKEEVAAISGGLFVFRKGETYYTLGTDGTTGSDGHPAHGLTKLVYERPLSANRFLFTLGPAEKGKEVSFDCGDKCAPFIQPGISGSPVVNAAGEVVGIVNGFSQTSVFEIYVTPISRVLPDLRNIYDGLRYDTLPPGTCEGGASK